MNEESDSADMGGLPGHAGRPYRQRSCPCPAQRHPIRRRAAQQWVQGQDLELRSNLDQSAAEIEQRTAEIHSVRTSIAALGQTLLITRELDADYKRLYDRQYIAKHAYLEKRQSQLDQERERALQHARLGELEAARKAAQGRHDNVLAQTRRSMLDLQHEAEQRAASLAQELEKARQRDYLTRLTAPVDGTVQQLAIHTHGGVVTEALLENKDIGFVRPGQSVEVKVETFNFTKYGVIQGHVLSISNDAIEDEKRGLVYSARIQLDGDHIRDGANRVALSPGMAVRAEVKTDKRKVIDYFLSPFKTYVDESLGGR